MSFLSTIKELLGIRSKPTDSYSYNPPQKVYPPVTLGNCPFPDSTLIDTCSGPAIPLIGENVAVAKNYIMQLNRIMSSDALYIRSTGKMVPTRLVIFPSSPSEHGSLLYCSPQYHPSSRSPLPFCLVFFTDLSKQINWHGDIYFNQDWELVAADVYYWERTNALYFHFRRIDGELILYTVCVPNSSGREVPVFECQYIIECREIRKAEEEDFLWLQSEIPDKCPKSISGYRRMKTQYTKNFQVLEQYALSQNRTLTNIGKSSPFV